MNYPIHVALTAVLTLASACLAGAETFDVVVYGGTPGGIAAALAAKRDGASVLLLEQKRHVGGLSTSGLTNAETSHLDEKTLGGICREFFTRLGKQYGKAVQDLDVAKLQERLRAAGQVLDCPGVHR